MGIIVKFAGRSIWEPSLRVGYCFVAQVRSIEELLDIQSGVSPVVSDELDINLASFKNFLSVCLDKLERTNNGDLFALVMGCLHICIALNWQMGGKLPKVSPRLQPILEGAGAIKNANWRITSIEPLDEEVNDRSGGIQDTRDWRVYPRS